MLDLWSMSEPCPICSRKLGVAYHGKKIRKKFCSRKCEQFFKEHFCIMYRNGEFESYCKNKIYKSIEKFCSEKCKEDFFKKGNKTYETKTCSKCSVDKNYVEFRYRDRGWKSPDGFFRQSYCRDCENQRLKDKRDEAPEHRLFLLARRRAKRDNLPFNITQEYIRSIWPKDNKCPIFKTIFKSGLINKNTLPTIDKVVPKKGYTKGNVVIISFRANYLKSDIEDVKMFKTFYDFYKNFN